MSKRTRPKNARVHRRRARRIHRRNSRVLRLVCVTQLVEHAPETGMPRWVLYGRPEVRRVHKEAKFGIHLPAKRLPR